MRPSPHTRRPVSVWWQAPDLQEAVSRRSDLHLVAVQPGNWPRDTHGAVRPAVCYSDAEQEAEAELPTQVRPGSGSGALACSRDRRWAGFLVPSPARAPLCPTVPEPGSSVAPGPCVSGPCHLTLSFPSFAPHLSPHPRLSPPLPHTPLCLCLAAVSPCPFPQRPQQQWQCQGWRSPMAWGCPNLLTQFHLSLPQPGTASFRHRPPLQHLLPRLRLHLPGRRLLQASLAHACRHHQPGEGSAGPPGWGAVASCQPQAVLMWGQL